jgi:DNA-binding transcriptional regulator YiaG
MRELQNWEQGRREPEEALLSVTTKAPTRAKRRRKQVAT